MKTYIIEHNELADLTTAVERAVEEFGECGCKGCDDLRETMLKFEAKLHRAHNVVVTTDEDQ